MDFETLLELVGTEPVFETSLLLAGDVNPNAIRLQLTRWVQNGRLYQLRRGLYALAPPYQKVKPHPYLIANRLQPASYVSLEAVLADHELIPDTVQRITSVTAGRPREWVTPLGAYLFRHVRADLLVGYRMTDLGGGQQALVATPEKALLDRIYLQPGGDNLAFLQELRLQNLEQLDLEALRRLAEGFNTPKMHRAAEVIARLAKEEAEEYRSL